MKNAYRQTACFTLSLYTATHDGRPSLIKYSCHTRHTQERSQATYEIDHILSKQFHHTAWKR